MQVVRRSNIHLTFLVLLLSDHSHGHSVDLGLWVSGAPTWQPADLQGAEGALQRVLAAGVPSLALPPLLGQRGQPVVHLQADGVHAMRHAGTSMDGNKNKEDGGQARGHGLNMRCMTIALCCSYNLQLL